MIFKTLAVPDAYKIDPFHDIQIALILHDQNHQDFTIVFTEMIC